MNNRERFLKVMHFEVVDHPPLALPGPWSATRKRWEQEGLPVGVDLYDYFNVPPWRLQHIGVETVFQPAFDEVIIEQTPEFTIKINRQGVKERNFPDGTSMPEFLEYPIKGRESLTWLRERLDSHAPGRIESGWLEKARRAQAEGTVVFCNGGQYFGFLNEHMGTEQLLLGYYDQPDFIQEVCELQCALCEQALRLALPQIKLDYIGYHEDMAYKNGSMISPALFREFMLPYYRRIRSIAKPYGADIQLLDSDGNIHELIPLWLECGINCLVPMEVAAGMDVVALRKQYGRSLLMMGGFDKRILAAGTPQIKAELERLRPLIESGGYIPAIDHGTPPDVSWENACYYVETLKSMFGMD